MFDQRSRGSAVVFYSVRFFPSEMFEENFSLFRCLEPSSLTETSLLAHSWQ